ncbi:hypothetical protein [Parathalassolituus penaei]|uniref:Uncharacterized protein n=1 Tax=Parathalassolituus penaei TaxID=2997323 RepID=A0A9X3IUG8_9GAMM|nr:hypothetical protein [Parathalassolituus penaei]MCY0966158.1 hypothetical protein [Parathalassolituus penaei]
MNQYVIVNVCASVRAETAGLVFFTRDGSVTHDLERAGIWTEGEVNADLDRFDNGSTTRAVLVSAVPKLLAEAVAGEAINSHERILISNMANAMQRVLDNVGTPDAFGRNTAKGRALNALAAQYQNALQHLETCK